jgi:predicted RNA binding protein YcfA (HicA-like mRNA interferase family)
MKRRKLLRHLRQHGCRFLREGASHEVWYNPANGQMQPVPRHVEVSPRLIRTICRKLEIEPPSEK